MHPLTETTPKPLLEVKGKPLIGWHLEKLARAQFTHVVINVSHLAQQIVDYVGDGTRYGLEVRYSHERIALEAGGGLATASPLLADGVIAVISADVYSDLDYRVFRTYGATLAPNRAHWWFAPARLNAPGREFSLRNGRVYMPGEDAQSLANLGLMHTSLFRDWPAGEKFKLLPYYQEWVRKGWVTGEHVPGQWENVTTPFDLDRLNAQP